MVYQLTDIMSGFKQLQKGGQELSLLNVYKGVPISYPAKIQAVGDQAISVVASPYQMVCMHRSKVTFIQSNLLQGTIKANVHQMNLGKNEAVLANFIPVSGNIGSRKLVRVEPADPIDFFIEHEPLDFKVKASMLDISINGLAFNLIKEYFNPRAFKSGQEFNAYIPLPQSGQFRGAEVKLRCQVVNQMNPRWSRMYRIGMRSLPDEKTRMIISQYISQRQNEIVREVKGLYDMISKMST